MSLQEEEMQDLTFFKLLGTITHANTHIQPCSAVPVWVDLQHGFIKLWDLPVDERLQRLLQPMIVPLQLPLVLLLVWTNQALVLAQGIFTPVWYGGPSFKVHFVDSWKTQMENSPWCCKSSANLLVKSLKQSRSLLWCLYSLGSLGISDRNTWATSSGPWRNGSHNQTSTTSIV